MEEVRRDRHTFFLSSYLFTNNACCHATHSIRTSLDPPLEPQDRQDPNSHTLVVVIRMVDMAVREITAMTTEIAAITMAAMTITPPHRP